MSEISSRPKSHSTIRKTRPVRSCTECKQVKLRCDARQSFPSPCSRCKAKQLECIIDAEFRRTPARLRLDELRAEIRGLKQSMNATEFRETSSDAHDDHFEAAVSDGCSSSFCESEEALADLEEARIGNCTLTRDELVTIFSTFAVYFYQHLPIIDPSMTPGVIQRSSPFLFWTIVTIVIQRMPAPYSAHRPSLTEAYTDLLGKAILATPLTLSTIQGLLYISTWPIAVDYQARDPSWNLVGIAVNAALYSGLHKATHPHSLRSVGVYGESPVRTTLWLGCFYISTCLSQTVGVPPTLRSADELATIARITHDPSIPKQLSALAEIQLCVAKYMVLVSESSESQLTALLERSFKHELELTKDRFVSCWNSHIELIFLSARLHIIAAIVVSQSKRMNTSKDLSLSPDHLLAITLSEGFSSAIGFIQGMCHGGDEPVPASSIANQAVPASSLYMRGLPKIYFRTILFAAFYLLRYHISGPSDNAEDGTLARKHVDMVCVYLRQASTDPSDEPGRSGVVIETLMRASMSPQAADLSSMRISDRLGASILYDALTKAHELRTKPAKLYSDQDQPQRQTVGAQSSPAGNGIDAVGVAERGLDTANGGEDSMGYQPMEWFQGLDLDALDLSGDLFSEAALFG